MAHGDLEDAADLFGLTPAKTEVCRLLLRGLGQSEIAYALGKSVNTVKTQVHEIYLQLGIHGREELFLLAHQELREHDQRGDSQE